MIRKNTLLTVILIVLALLGVNLPKRTINQIEKQLTLPSPAPVSTISAKLNEGMPAVVTTVIDGDTIEIQGGFTVRYIGIDTPEVKSPQQKNECFSKESSEKNKELVMGKQVRLEKDVSETDKYGRLLRYVYVGDVFINKELVRLGYANARSYPPDIKYQKELRETEKEARSKKLGLWGTCN